MIKVNDKVAISVEDYKGSFSLCEGWVTREGEFKLNWCTVEYGKEKVKKNVPVRVRLGDKAAAIAALRQVIEEISGKKESASPDEEPF